MNMLKVSVTDMDGNVLELLVAVDNLSAAQRNEIQFAHGIRDVLERAFNVCDDNPEDIQEMLELIGD